MYTCKSTLGNARWTAFQPPEVIYPPVLFPLSGYRACAVTVIRRSTDVVINDEENVPFSVLSTRLKSPFIGRSLQWKQSERHSEGNAC